jgi:hypothetical protein
VPPPLPAPPGTTYQLLAALTLPADSNKTLNVKAAMQDLWETKFTREETTESPPAIIETTTLKLCANLLRLITKNILMHA